MDLFVSLFVNKGGNSIFNRKRYIQLFSLFIYLVAITWLILQVIKINSGLKFNGTIPLIDFWNIQLSGVDSSLIVDTLTMILYTTFGSILFIYIKNNHTFYNIQQRIGYVKFLKISASITFLSAFLLSIFTKIYELLFIIILLRRFPSNIKLEKFLIQPPFNDNTLKSMIIFTLLSAIGWGIFAVFIFSLGLFIRKTSIYFVLGATVGTSLIVIPGIFVPILGIKSVPFFSLWFLPSLIAPGQLNFAVSNGQNINVYTLFFFSFFIYSTISWILMRQWIIRKRRRG
ncbi:hypothetical protein MEPL4_7c00390 [Melissococcus plutonius]|uniref:Uncharacterized protein n=2 Tax=Melissococcus plutonius TaxID=33970 RepID=F3YCM1_MELPT|nr:hypothetical protein [Melissococcus plutonius]AIM26159.2 hypothetical protein MEPL_178p001350 [Melissococcus plutonius S1]KMT23574.1 hypothetical protein MEPL2_5c00910 [Melissococcus plutonius]KMT23624.1 hypothetical protein MEPL3_9c00150 [Melissococcus plutonius]KMT24261.1 hypothetical protein MEPL1_10c00070 [Melissococcus plutonius]KMT28088.1 hypothetical protein MEPL4_7c00390 [Melissococcus plutonius]